MLLGWIFNNIGENDGRREQAPQLWAGKSIYTLSSFLFYFTKAI